MREFFEWWRQQLAELLPGSPAARTAGIDATIVEIDRDSVSLLIRRRGAVSPAARVALGHARSDQPGQDPSGFREIARFAANRKTPAPLVLQIPAINALHKRLSFPLAARSGLEGLLGFEMDRETPFERDEVYWSYDVRPRLAGSGRIEVDLVIIPRAAVDGFIAALRRAGLDPAGVEIAVAPGETILVPLGSPAHRQGLRAQHSLIALAAAACLLAVVAAAVPLIRQQRGLAAADAAVAALTTQAEEAGQLRQSVDRLAAAAEFLGRQRAHAGSALAALAATTRVLPDDTYLTALELRSGRLTISGLSPSAAGLIDRLSKMPQFREPEFAAPVVPGEGGLETFTITVTLAAAGAS